MSNNNIDELSDDELKQLEDDAAEYADTAIHCSDLPDTVYSLKAYPYNETYFAVYENKLIAGTKVIAVTRYGKDVCDVLGVIKPPPFIRIDDLVKIDRIATDEDIARRNSDIEKEAAAFDICLEKINAHNLPMKLIFAHYLFDESKILFFFTADTRVDFRNLVKDLVSIFKARIELRQIGVRDEARVIGGCGVCGRVLCCNSISDKLIPVSIKMAKDQNLSLNSLKISGPCGRLLCCLAYEFNFYRESRKSLPQEGNRIPYDGTVFKVIELNIPSGKIKLFGDDGRYLDVPASRCVQHEGRWKILDLPES